MPPTGDINKLMAGAPTKARLCLHLLHRGVATVGGKMFILSAAHNEEDIDQTIKALSDSLVAMVEEGALTKG